MIENDWDQFTALARQRPPLAEETLQALREANKELPLDSSRAQAITKLEKGAAVVITGQQPGLFVGPALVDLKITTTIMLAEKLERSGIPAVPIFWNASEDHDVDEADRIFLRSLRRDETTLHHLGLSPKQQSLDRFHLSDEQCHRAASLFEECGERSRPKKELPGTGERFSSWCSRLVAHRFGGRGLLVVEPRHLEPVSREFLKTIADRTDDLNRAFDRSSETLSKNGDKPQLSPVRSEDTWLFINEASKRRRLSRNEATSAGADLGPDQRLSTSAHARPLWQQEAFAAAAQVVGPSEGLYLRQLEDCFEVMKLPAPILWPRNHAFLATPADMKLIDDAGFSEEQAINLGDHWDGPALEVPPTWRSLREKLESSRARHLEETRRALEEEPELVDLLKNYHRGEERAALKFDEAIDRAAKRRMKDRRHRFRRLRESFFPKGRPQERVRSLACYSDDPKKIIDQLFATLDPEDPSPRLVQIENDDNE